MSHTQANVIVILLLLIFLACAAIATNVGALGKKSDDPKQHNTGDDRFVEFGGSSDYAPATIINCASVTHLEHLTGEGGTKVHLRSGVYISLGESLRDVAKRLGQFDLKRY